MVIWILSKKSTQQKKEQILDFADIKQYYCIMFGKMISGGKSKSTENIDNDSDETIIPTIEITEYGSPLTPVLMEYEMIRMGRDAERTLSQLLLKAGSKSKIPQFVFASSMSNSYLVSFGNL